MTDMKLVVAGASGRMGLSLIKAIHQSKGVCVIGALEREGADAIGKDAGELAGVGKIGIEITSNPASLMKAADGIIDFTIPAATVKLSKLAADAGIVHVIGTTGCSLADETELREAAKKATIVKSGNMSLGVNLLSILVEQAAKALDSSAFDIEIVEMHHKHKVDAPSGTALLLGEAAAKGRDIELEPNSVRARDGHTGPRETGTIGFSTLRGGSVVGDHTVIFAGEGERIELSHIAQDRMNFAFGAVKAAKWAKNKKPNYYTMHDVLGFGN
jgi:4-hydroxy-tetrahydrodipicolinate reductase